MIFLLASWEKNIVAVTKSPLPFFCSQPLFILSHNTGRVEICSDMTLTVNSDLNGGSPQFTLTCYTLGDLEKGIYRTSDHFFSKSS